MSDYLFQLESHLDASQHRVVLEMQRIATEAGVNVWLTGGAMRDVLRGARVYDLDFTVEHDAPKAGKALAQALGGHIVSEDPLTKALGGTGFAWRSPRFRCQFTHGKVRQTRREASNHACWYSRRFIAARLYHERHGLDA